MGNLLKLLATAVVVILLVNACSKPSTLGSELLELDQENVEFTDTIQVFTKTILRDSVVAFNPEAPLSELSLGNYKDPNFGAYKADAFFQVSPTEINIPQQAGIRIDSVMLSLGIDSSQTIGSFNSNLQLEVYELLDSLNQEDNAYSNVSYPSKPNVLGSYDGQPSTTDRNIVYSASGDTIVNDLLLRIPLEIELGERLLDSANIIDLDKNFFGFHIKTMNASPTESLLSVAAENNITRLVVYYTNIVDSDTTRREFQFIMSPIDFRSNYLERDISGTLLESYLDGSNTDSDVTFVQGLSGPDVSVDLSQITDLGDVLINSAVLTVTAKNIDGSMSAEYPILDDIILLRLNEDDEFIGIDDHLIGQSVFGGDFESEIDDPNNVLGTYRLDFSDYVQKIVDGEEDPILYLRALPKISSTGRTVLFGDDSIDYKPKLELTFTRINQ